MNDEGEFIKDFELMDDLDHYADKDFIITFDFERNEDEQGEEVFHWDYFSEGSGDNPLDGLERCFNWGEECAGENEYCLANWIEDHVYLYCMTEAD